MLQSISSISSFCKISDLVEASVTSEIIHSFLKGSFFLLSALMRSSLKISAAVIGMKVIFLPLCLKEYLLAMVLCTTLFSDIQGLPSNKNYPYKNQWRIQYVQFQLPVSYHKNLPIGCSG